MGKKQGSSTRGISLTTWAVSGGGKTPQKTVDETRSFFWDRVVAVAEQQAGFQGALLLTEEASGETMSLTSWATRAEMEAAEADARYREEVEKFTSLFAEPLPVRHYETNASGTVSPGGMELDVHASCCPDGQLSLTWSTMGKVQRVNQTGRPVNKVWFPDVRADFGSSGGSTQKAVEISDFFWNQVTEVAQRQAGFAAAMLLTNPETGEILSLTMWDSKAEREAAEANEEFSRTMKTYVSLLASPSPVKYYEGEHASAVGSGVELDVQATCCPEGTLTLKWSAK